MVISGLVRSQYFLARTAFPGLDIIEEELEKSSAFTKIARSFIACLLHLEKLGTVFSFSFSSRVEKTAWVLFDPQSYFTVNRKPKTPTKVGSALKSPNVNKLRIQTGQLEFSLRPIQSSHAFLVTQCLRVQQTK